MEDIRAEATITMTLIATLPGPVGLAPTTIPAAVTGTPVAVAVAVAAAVVVVSKGRLI